MIRGGERRRGAKVFHHSFEGDVEGGGGVLVRTRQVVVRAGAVYLSFLLVPEAIAIGAIETTECLFLLEGT